MLSTVSHLSLTEAIRINTFELVTSKWRKINQVNNYQCSGDHVSNSKTEYIIT